MGDDLKKKLWAAADKFRAQIHAAEYKHIVLGLIFLKYDLLPINWPTRRLEFPLMSRDLRRWGGGRESSFVYHYAKNAAMPLIIASWVQYLALPVSLHPS